MPARGQNSGQPSWGAYLDALADEHGSLAAVSERLAATHGWREEVESITRALRRLRDRGSLPGGKWGDRLLRTFGLPGSVDARLRFMGSYHSRFVDLPVPLCSDLVQLWDRPPTSESKAGRLWLSLARATLALRQQLPDEAREHLLGRRGVELGREHAQLGSLDPRACVLSLCGLSKNWVLPGWRIGFAAGNTRLVGALTRIKSYLDYGAFTPVQVAATAALNGPQDCVQGFRDLYRGRRDVLVDGLAKAGWAIPKPDATMFCWAPVPEQFKPLGSMGFAKLLLEEADVAVSPGIGFGEYGEGYVRLALVENRQRLRQAVRSIRTFMARHGNGAGGRRVAKRELARLRGTASRPCTRGRTRTGRRPAVSPRAHRRSGSDRRPGASWRGWWP